MFFTSVFVFVFVFFFLTAIWQSHGQLWAILKEMLTTAFVQVWPEGHREPCNEVGSLSPAERLAGFEPGTFRFWLQRLNPQGHEVQIHNALNH